MPAKRFPLLPDSLLWRSFLLIATLMLGNLMRESGAVERSTFSVVRNTGRLLPYYASLLTFLGLLGFALQRLWKARTPVTGGGDR